MIKNIRNILIIRKNIRKILRDLDGKLLFDSEKKKEIEDSLMRLEKVLDTDPECVYPILVSLYTDAQVYSFKKEITKIMRVFTSMEDNKVNHENVRSLAYI
ncbi:MAG: hypothetical protein GF329_11965 [Candidatus Lokiarchaeota archaeon]|nr:hypothetical protein [Candidatus Lokiarchaeota archaeon]